MKDTVFSIIRGDQVHHFCDYLISKGYQPNFSYYPADGGSFSAYNGHSWFPFYDTEDGEQDRTEVPYNLSAPFSEQSEEFFTLIESFLKII